jgi:putative cardiolipin synthase
VKLLRNSLLCIAAAGIAFAGVRGCNRLPSLEGRSQSTAMTGTLDTRIGLALTARIAAHPQQSGIYALTDAREAFAARMVFADAAERSLDVQCYIWHDDLSGTLLFDALRRAAARGVRVRLLLDDNNTAGLDGILAALDAHPNAEVRLFNPFMTRTVRIAGYLTDFPRLNRRMHNKSFTADNQVTIVGGRNIGDEYFDATAEQAFVDVDVIAIGPVVRDVSDDFDRYWASESAYPVERLFPAADAAAIRTFESAAARIERDPMAIAYVEAVRKSAFVNDLVQGDLAMEWAATRMVSDDPAKVFGHVTAEPNLFSQLKAILGEPKKELLLVSPYFVPATSGTEWFSAAARRGVRIQVLTNAQEATDVAAVHAGYSKRRKALLAAGITLFESRRRTPDTRKRSKAGMAGSSASSLHAKTFAIDGERVFVGSLNFDPRSAVLNTEMGFVIDSPALARRVSQSFESSVPERAYEVRLSDEGDLYWIERKDGRVTRLEVEPGTGLFGRAGVKFLSWMPIEWLL